MKKFNKKGFTLIELLLVILIIGVLAVSVYVALNPAGRLAAARNAKRSSDVQSILTAIHTYIVDNKGALPPGLSTGMAEKQLGTASTGCTISTGGCNVAGAADCVDLSTPLAKYLKSIPVDPDGGTASLTKYSVVVDTNGIVTVKACGAENGVTISASR
jgi:prepilin-type N-terminal cleavage/methylation domain-containing protein